MMDRGQFCSHFMIDLIRWLADKNYVIRRHGKNVAISIDHLKPAYIFSERSINDDESKSRSTTETPGLNNANDAGSRERTSMRSSRKRDKVTVTTRSGRRVRFPDRY